MGRGAKMCPVNAGRDGRPRLLEISAHRSQHKTGGEVARMEVLVDGVLGNYYIAVGRGI